MIKLCLAVVLFSSAVFALTIKPTYTVSGLSAGAFMAVQYHVAHSSEVSGAAVFAGGPFYCAQGKLEYALSVCTIEPLLISMTSLYNAAKSMASSGDIDDLKGLGNDNVFLFSGKLDSVVHQGVVKKAGEWYQNFGANVTEEYSVMSEHCQPTKNFGNECYELESPYISKCNYDGAGTALTTLLNRPLNPRGSFNSSNLVSFDQRKYFPSGGATGLADRGYVYVPSSCKSGATCDLHVDFHGCNQGEYKIHATYYEHAGYIEWAETNNVVVLFPQASKDLIKNPNGCFDWWGYSSTNYASKSAPQMTAFSNMVAWLKNPSTAF